MRNYILQNFPFLEDDFDALTDYQLFCKFMAYVKKFAIDNEEFKKRLDTYENYFNNLDVQEEINNKLDEMYENGELASIVAQFLELNVLFNYDTLEDLKDADNLVNGCYAKTYGYNIYNDGGNALYKIRTKTNDDTPDDMFIIELTNANLVGELIYHDKVNANQIGIFGDGETDVSDLIKNALLHPINLYLPNGTYLISKQIAFGNNNMSIIGESKENTIIKIEDNISSDVTFTSYIASTNLNNIEVSNLKIDGGTQTVNKYILSLIQGENITVSNLEIFGGCGYSGRFNNTVNLNASNIYIHDIYGHDTVTGGLYGMNMTNARFEHIRGEKLGDHLLYVTGDEGGDCNNIYINDIYGDDTGKDGLTNGSAITIYGNTYNVNLSNVNIINSTQAINITEHGETLECPKDIVISNVIAKNCRDGVIIRGKEGNLVDNVILSNVLIDTQSQDGISIRYGSNITINNNIIKNITRYGIDFRNSKNIVIQNNNIVNAGVGIRSDEYNDIALITNNIGTVTLDTLITCNYGLIISGQSTNHKAYSNVFTGFAISNYLIRGTTNKALFEGNNNSTNSDVIRSIYYGTNVGTTIDGEKGDIIINSNPSVGSPWGWICIESGTPGTWKAINNISA